VGIASERRGHDLHLAAFDLLLSPRGLDLQQTESGGIRTSTIVHVSHPVLIPDGLYEFQHAVGEDVVTSLRSGFSQWGQLDLPVLCDVTREAPEDCSTLEMTFPDEGGGQHKRRVLLGPTGHMVRPPERNEEEEDDEHPFCPCCLTTNCLEAFAPLLKAKETLGLRLFAARSTEGEISADCRVNGEEFAPGIAALIAYAESWPERGFEFRKQYVVFQTC
jgi:uncharacterized protein DUF6348